MKEYQSRYDVESIKREVEVIRHLRHKNMPVPVFLPNVRNEFYTKHRNRLIIVEEFIEGVSFNE